MPDEKHRAFRAHFGFCQSFGNRQHGNRSRTVVIRAVEDFVIARRVRVRADVIVMCADGDIFVFQNRIAAFPDGDDILRFTAFPHGSIVFICRLFIYFKSRRGSLYRADSPAKIASPIFAETSMTGKFAFESFLRAIFREMYFRAKENF